MTDSESKYHQAVSESSRRIEDAVKKVWEGVQYKRELGEGFHLKSKGDISLATLVIIEDSSEDVSREWQEKFLHKLDKSLKRYSADKELYRAILRDALAVIETLEGINRHEGDLWGHYSFESKAILSELRSKESNLEKMEAEGITEEDFLLWRDDFKDTYNKLNSISREREERMSIHFLKSSELCRMYAEGIEERIINLDATTSVPPQAQGAEIITDGNGNVVGVVVYGKFQWLCSKADIGRICRYMIDNKLVTQGVTELARKTAQHLPESAKEATKEESSKTLEEAMKKAEKATTERLRNAINNGKRGDRQASQKEIDAKSSAEAVLRFWKESVSI